MLNEVSRIAQPAALCTIYEPRFADATERRLAATALTLLNDKITRQAFARGLTLIELRLICEEDADFAPFPENSGGHGLLIEPSAHGGAKIAQAILRFSSGVTPRSPVYTDR